MLHKAKRPCMQLIAQMQFEIQEAEYSLFHHAKSVIAIDGFTFRINGISIPVDFNAYSISLDESRGRDGWRTITVVYQSGQGLLFSEYETSDVYDALWAKHHLKPADITADFLIKAEGMEEILLTCSLLDKEYPIHHFQLQQLLLRDGKQEYKFSADFLRKSSAKICF